MYFIEVGDVIWWDGIQRKRGEKLFEKMLSCVKLFIRSTYWIVSYDENGRGDIKYSEGITSIGYCCERCNLFMNNPKCWNAWLLVGVIFVIC